MGILPETAANIEVYNLSGLRRPTHDFESIVKMNAHSNLVITAWIDDELVGIYRALTDFIYACYLSDFAVKKQYQSLGIGRQLIGFTQKEINPQTALILLSAPEAMENYPK